MNKGRVVYSGLLKGIAQPNIACSRLAFGFASASG